MNVVTRLHSGMLLRKSLITTARDDSDEVLSFYDLQEVAGTMTVSGDNWAMDWSESSSNRQMKFWKPGAEAPGREIGEEKENSGESAAHVAVYNPNASLSIERQRQSLPVFRYRNHILYLVEKHKTVVIVGETGCGKSTQIPQYLLEAGWAADNRTVAVTEPRRVAAITVAKRVAEECGAVLGDKVGYAVRFDDRSDSSVTRLKFLTDGLLIREMMSDPLLSRYSVIMLDEAHERSLCTDVVIGLLKKIQRRRPELRIIVTSATLDAEKVRDFFALNESGTVDDSSVAVLSIEGRAFPVDIFYSLDPVPDYIKATIDTVMKIHASEPVGDVLCFLTGQDEVDSVVRSLVDESRKQPRDAMRMRVLPMHGSLPAADQLRVFERVSRGTRKVVVATNIAEASVTIDGIVYVVDAGFVKLPAYDSSSGIETLIITPVSQASAEQRAGRAGRVRSGKVYRLYTEESYNGLPMATVPEVQRCDTAPIILQLKALGIDNIVRFSFLSPPPAANLVLGVELLFALGALDQNAHLTQPLGFNMAELPVTPMLARSLLASEEFNCSEEMAIIAAVSQIENIFVSAPKHKLAAEREKRRFSVSEGDHVTLLNVFLAFDRNGRSSKWCRSRFLNYRGLCRSIELRDQLVRMLKKFKINMVSCDGDVTAVRRCLTAGFFPNSAVYHPTGVYRTVRDGVELSVHPSSVLYTETPAPCVLFGDVVQASSKRYLMRDVTVIEASWLYEIAPHYYEYGTDNELARKRSRFVE